MQKKEDAVNALIENYQPKWQVSNFTVTDSMNGKNESVAVLESADKFDFSHYVGLRFHEGFESGCIKLGNNLSKKVAIDYIDSQVSYEFLSHRANQLARFFQAQGVGPGDRIALLLDRSVDSYASVLAASKLSAAYVPLDASFPADRIHYMLEDSEVSVVFTLAMFSELFVGVEAKVIYLEENLSLILESSSAPFQAIFNPQEIDALAYIIYTSGSTGRPKGVPIRHSSICNFMQVATKLYGYLPADRVYQGLTIAFDFSFEEVWIPLFAGAALVPAPANVKLVGSDLTDFLASQEITALCCVPTMLATLEPNLPKLRFLLLSGEACQADVVSKWLIPSRRVLNVYGPTETTVTATWSVLEPNKPITIGGPLPTYQMVIVDPETHKAVKLGEVGEICIAGVGLCDDYLNRPEKTEQAFMPDYIGLPDNPSKRLYRTGDLGKINEENEIEYLGRIDTQVKIRGYRIELSEIESIARSVEGVEQAVVQPFDLGNGKLLVAYIMPVDKEQPFDMNPIHNTLKLALPNYMVPAYYEQLAEIPVLASGKTDRNALKPPTSNKLISSETEFVAPETEVEQKLSNLLAKVLKVEKISIQANFFNDLGADSLTMATYVTSIRNHMDLRQLSMRQLYENASIALLAKSIESNSLTEGRLVKSATTKALASDKYKVNPYIASDLARGLVGIGQVLMTVLWLFGITYLTLYAYHWTEAAQGFINTYLRAIFATSAIFIIPSLVLIATKWLSIGKFSQEAIPIWSFHYFRFWVAQKAIKLNPMNLSIGTPIYNLYLRLLGVKVGRNSVVLCKAPVCTDLISIGDNTTIRQNVFINGYIAKDGYLHLGAIDIGSNVLLCEDSVLDINTKIGNGAQVGMVSSVREGQSIPASSTYQGTPAEPSKTNYLRIKPKKVTNFRKIVFTISDVLSKTVLGAVFVTIIALLVNHGISNNHFSVDSIILVSAIIYFGGLLFSMLYILLIPRILHLFVVPEVTHPLYGFQYELVHAISKMTNHKLFNLMFGDSSMVLYWLSALGYDLKSATQSGSNFGVAQSQNSPYLIKFNQNTMVADGLNLLNIESSTTSFILRSINVPQNNYFGNKLHYPAYATIGENCLIGTKAAFPIDGEIKSNVGLLGSPVFEIPRAVLRDQQFEQYKQPDVLKQRLAMKLRSNLITLALYMLRSWVFVALFMLLFILCEQLIEPAGGHTNILFTALEFTIATFIFIPIGSLLGIFCERLVCGFKKITPKFCSIYDPQFWAHERFWKQSFNESLAVFNGTPFKAIFLRLQGAKVGKRLFDDGSGFAEPSMVEIGDDCILNDQSFIQCHSLEDGIFKSDNIKIGTQCNLGINTFIQYGVVMENNSTLESNALLMKGSLIKANTRWYGNPAREDALSGS